MSDLFVVIKILTDPSITIMIFVRDKIATRPQYLFRSHTFFLPNPICFLWLSKHVWFLKCLF